MTTKPFGEIYEVWGCKPRNRKLDAEEIILSMAEIIYENRRLRSALEEAKQYEEKYTQLLGQSVDDNMKSAQLFLKFVLQEDE